MTKSRVTGIALPLSYKNCMRISTWDSLSTNLEGSLFLSKILLVHTHIIIHLTPDTMLTLRLFYYGKYWKKIQSRQCGEDFFSRSPLSIIFIQYNTVVARGTVKMRKLTVAAQKSLKSLRVLTTSMDRSIFPFYLKRVE